MKFCLRKLESSGSHSEDFVILFCTVLIGLKGVTDEWTDAQGMTKTRKA